MVTEELIWKINQERWEMGKRPLARWEIEDIVSAAKKRKRHDDGFGDAILGYALGTAIDAAMSSAEAASASSPSSDYSPSYSGGGGDFGGGGSSGDY